MTDRNEQGKYIKTGPNKEELRSAFDRGKADAETRFTRSLEEAELAKARRDSETLRLKHLTKLAARTERYVDEIRDQIEHYKPIPFSLIANKDKRPQHEHIAILSDWHIGQETTTEETGSLFTQNIEISTKQVQALAHANARLFDLETSSRNIQKLHVMALGDLVDGDDMRNSQHRKIGELLAPQTIRTARLLAWYVEEALQRYPEVEVEVVGGNHDRLSRKPGDSGLGELGYEDTAAWLIGEILRITFASEPRVKITNWRSFFGLKIVCERRIVFEHGSSFRWGTGGYGGVPYYGIQMTGMRYQQMLDGADLVLMGHGHMSMQLPMGHDSMLIMNGSLPPSSTYVQSSFKSVRRPSQWLLSLHRKQGLTGTFRMYADHEGIKKPGAIWTDLNEIRGVQNIDWE